MTYSDLYFLLPNQKLRNLLYTYVVKKEGGLAYSSTARAIFKKKYNVEIGYGSYGCFDYSQLRPNIKIGNYCSFGPGFRIFRANHKMELFTTHPATYGALGSKKSISNLEQKPLLIGNDVWIGANVIILPGCEKIGDGACIGAGSIVTKNVPPYTICAGNPCTEIRKRFNEQTISLLQESKWWELELSQLEEKMEFFQSIVDKNAR